MPSRPPRKVQGQSPRAIRYPSDPSDGSPGLRAHGSGAPTVLGAIAGFVVLVLLNSALLWMGVRTLHGAGIVGWTLSVREVVTLAGVWVMWRALDKALDGRRRS